MIQEVIYCTNCGKEMKSAFIHVDGEPTHMGIYVCSFCNILDIPKEFIKEMYFSLPAEEREDERTLADYDFRDTHGYFPGEKK